MGPTCVARSMSVTEWPERRGRRGRRAGNAEADHTDAVLACHAHEIFSDGGVNG